MKTVKLVSLVAFAMFLWQCGMYALGVPSDLPMWRWLLGISCLGFSVGIANWANK